MPDTKISQMTAATAVDGGDLVPIVQAGANKKAALSLLQALMSAPPTGTILLSGGGVAWNQNLDFTVSAAVYLIAGTQYASAQTNLTLGAADPTNDRIDIIAVDNTGIAIVIAGTPAPTPAAPDVDPATQLRLTFVYVAAAATVPSNVANVDIYLENTEYTSSTNSGNFVLASTNNPFAGTKDIEATNGASGNRVDLVKPSGTLDLTQYTSLVLQIRSKAAWPSAKSVSVVWMNGAAVVGSAVAIKTGVLGFDSSIIGSYQQVVIPISSFGTGASPVDRVRISIAGGGAAIGFYLDNIILQGGITGGGGAAGDFSTNSAVSVAGEIVVFADTTGKMGRRGGMLARIKTDGSFQLWNPTQSKFHTISVSGAAGEEVLEIGAGET